MALVFEFFIWAIFLARQVMTIFAQLPAQGIQLGSVYQYEIDFRFPLVVSQCEPIFIWYNKSVQNPNIYFTTPDLNETDTNHGLFLQIAIPIGSGYIEWICNIPAGHAFIVGYGFKYYMVIHPGTSSACLRNVTTTYEYATYFTSVFEPYTALPPNTTRPIIDSYVTANLTVPFITGEDITTITANPDLVIASTTTHSKSTWTPSWLVTSRTRSSIVTPSSPPPATASQKLNVPATAGGIIGIIIIAGVAFSIIFMFMRKRRTSEAIADNPIIALENFESGRRISQTADVNTRQPTNLLNGAVEPFDSGWVPNKSGVPTTRHHAPVTKSSRVRNPPLSHSNSPNMHPADGEGGGVTLTHPRPPRTTKRNPTTRLATAGNMRPAHDEGGSSSSTIPRPLRTTKRNATRPRTLPTLPIPESLNAEPHPDLTAALEPAPDIQPTVREEEAIITSVNPTPDADLLMRTLTTQNETARAEVQPEVPDSSNLLAALNIVSRLTAAERSTLASVLNSTTAGPSDGLSGDGPVVPVRDPPAYDA